jgi:murein DD-endopeptidase MepM/ murein hydrolase activator NlpD
VAKLAIVALLFAGLSAPVIADDTLDQKVEQAGEALSEASKEVLAARKSLEETQTKLVPARAALDEAKAKEAAAYGLHQQAQDKLDVAKKDYAAALAKVTSKEAEIAKLQLKVDQFARSIYQQGPTSQWEIVLQSESPSDLTSRLETIKAVSKASANSLVELEDARVVLEGIADEAEVVRMKMQGLADEAEAALVVAQAAADVAEAAKAEVDRLVAIEKKALAVAEKDKAKVKKVYDELRAEQIRIANAAGSASVGSGDPQATGPLQWPLPGHAAGGGVGWRVHPVYGYRSCHTGVDSGAPSGTIIQAADAGVVLNTFWSKPYGRVTLIDHGQGLVTMYAHQSAWLVSTGDVVGVGDAIGKVGSTGYSTGPHLHFEVHINGVPYNPMGWFGASKTRVSCWG